MSRISVFSTIACGFLLTGLATLGGCVHHDREVVVERRGPYVERDRTVVVHEHDNDHWDHDHWEHNHY